jgi:hypothetical protein
MKIVISLVLIGLTGFWLVKNIIALVKTIKEKKKNRNKEKGDN